MKKGGGGGTSKVYAAMLLILPLVEHLRILPIPSQTLFAAVFMLLPILNQQYAGKLSLDPWMLIYFLYALTNFLVFGSPEGRFSFRFVINIVKFCLTFFGYYVIGREILDKRYFIKSYKIICGLVTFAMLLQFVCGLAGHPFSMLPDGIPLASGLTSTERFEELKQIGRYSTVFMEPAHQIQYVMPCFVWSLFDRDEKGRKELWFPLFLSVGVVATTSMQGILGLGIMWGYYLFGILKERDKKTLAYLVVLSPILIAGLIPLLSSPVIQEQFHKKLNNLEGLQSHNYSGSSFLRVLCGWFCYHDFPLFQKLFGCGYGNVKKYLISSGIAQKYYNDLEQAGYMNGITSLLCQLGLVGFVLFFAFFMKCLPKKKTLVIRAMLLWWFALMLTSANFDTIGSFIPMLLMFTQENRPVLFPGRMDINFRIPKRETSLEGGGAT